MNKQEHIPLWIRNFNLLFFTNLFMSTGGQIILPTLPLFAMNALGATEAQIGTLLAVYSFAALLIRPFAGYSYDCIDRKATYVISLLLLAGVVFGHLLVSSFILLILFRFLHGLAFGVASAGGLTIAADLVHPKRRAEGVGYFTVSVTIAMAIGPAIGVYIMDASFSAVFIVSGILLSLAFITSNLVAYPKYQIPKRSLELRNLFEKRIFSLAFMAIMMHIMMGGIFSFVIVYGENIGIANPGIFFFLISVSVIIARLFAGRLQDRHGPKIIAYFAFAVLFLGYTSLSISGGLLQFSISALLIGLGNGSILPAMQAMAFNMVLPERRGAANSTYFAAIDVGIGGGSLLLGWVAGYTSLSAMFLFCAVFLAVPFLYFKFRVIKDYEIKEAEIRLLEQNRFLTPEA